MNEQKRLIVVVIFCFFLVSSLLSQILNLSYNNYTSEQPFILKFSDSEYVFWVDNSDEEHRISYRYLISDDWSECYFHQLSGDVDINDIEIRDNEIILLFDQLIDNENKLMIGILNESNEFESCEVVSYFDFEINSASLIIDIDNHLHLTWETYSFNESIRVHYATTDDIYTWDSIELLYDIEEQYPYCYPQLVYFMNGEIHCFWVSNIEMKILHTQKTIDETWQPYSQIPFNGFGEYFVVKKDVYDTIHLVSNQALLTTLHNDLYYIKLENGVWSDIELVPYWTYSNTPLNERWNPYIDFMDDNSVFISWEHYAFTENFFERGNWIGSTVEVSDGWFADGPYGLDREPNDPRFIITDNFVHFVWSDNSNGNYEIYYSIYEPYSILNDYSLIWENDFSLVNFPNPFNPTTKIEFYIPIDSSIEINIFNSRGQKIRSLIDSEYPEGKHSVIWEGEDEFGELVNSGVYLYSLKVNGKQESLKKCLLLK